MDELAIKISPGERERERGGGGGGKGVSKYGLSDQKRRRGSVDLSCMS